MNRTDFLQQLMRQPRETGAIAASGAPLCRMMAEAAGVDRATTIVELGPGTGVITDTIMARKRDDARVIGLEINADFAAATQRRCPAAEIVHADASDARRILADRGLSACDVVVSGLPWAGFPGALQNSLLDAVTAALRPGGIFVTFAYVHGLILPGARRFRQQLGARFADVDRTRPVWRNLPPAIVYRARTAAE